MNLMFPKLRSFSHRLENLILNVFLKLDSLFNYNSFIEVQFTHYTAHSLKWTVPWVFVCSELCDHHHSHLGNILLNPKREPRR